ncbi:MAG: hypothetical protein H7126_09080 [Candidatus Parcubacteria bacterium]|uniref:hypothetical protein n=1 Tax=Phormidesmis priestleyi TaxID=268141 RepID=UPI0012E78E2C|nr:hypothetical protein [Phormidesmis priestleyi]MBC7824020.1 hypothetical protein [Leptolyngbyaceae cyanobacterium LF-bin-113]
MAKVRTHIAPIDPNHYQATDLMPHLLNWHPHRPKGAVIPHHATNHEVEKWSLNGVNSST